MHVDIKRFMSSITSTKNGLDLSSFCQRTCAQLPLTYLHNDDTDPYMWIVAAVWRLSTILIILDRLISSVYLVHPCYFSSFALTSTFILNHLLSRNNYFPYHLLSYFLLLWWLSLSCPFKCSDRLSINDRAIDLFRHKLWFSDQFHYMTCMCGAWIDFLDIYSRNFTTYFHKQHCQHRLSVSTLTDGNLYRCFL